MSTLCHRTTGVSLTEGRRLPRAPAGTRELLLIGGLYVVYSLARVLASGDLGAATATAQRVLDLERLVHLDVEHPLNDLFAGHRWLAVPSSFYYAAAHYVATPAVLLWLWVGRRGRYPGARRALVAATAVALALYVALPTAPPRLVGGYHDVLAATSDVGWWSTSASAPQGLGGLTDELAAMPSMHVGWALWCALVLHAYAGRRALRALGWTHLALTVLVVVGTGNHWVLDAVVGAAIVGAAWRLLSSDPSSDPTTRRLGAKGQGLSRT